MQRPNINRTHPDTGEYWWTANYDELIEYVEELERIASDVVLLRGQGWQKRQEMHDAISKMGVMLGIGPHPTGSGTE